MTWHQNVSIKFKVFIKKVLEKKGPSIIVSSYNHKLRYLQTDRSSRPEVFCEKIDLKNFTKFTGKHLCYRTPSVAASEQMFNLLFVLRVYQKI